MSRRATGFLLSAGLVCAVAMVLQALPRSAAQEATPVAERVAPWDEDTIRKLASLPVQDRGRIKPLHTMAGFLLLKFNGKRSFETPAGERLKPLPWLLDVMFFPKVARTYPMFRIQNSEVVTAIELPTKRKRDYYSYDHLEPGLAKLEELAREYTKKEAKKRTPVQAQILELYQNLMEFLVLMHSLDFARQDYPLRGSTGLGKIYQDPKRQGLAYALELREGLFYLQAALQSKKLPAAAAKEEGAALHTLVGKIDAASRGMHPTLSLRLFPPDPRTETHDHDHKTWYSVRDLIMQSFSGRDPLKRQLGLLAYYEALERTKGEPAAFRQAAADLHEGVTKLATERGEYDSVPLEVTFYRGDFFFRALLVYLLAFLLVAAGWMRPKSKGLYWTSWGALTLATLLLVIGITLRCIVQGRPPVTTLYETILFTTACGVITLLAVEWINRLRIGLALAPILGALGMFLAHKYEFKAALDGGDAMQVMRAVLDTNFWLSTHVTTVTLGYSAGLVAAAFAHVYLLGKLFGYRAGDRSYYKGLARMTYGVLCFGLLFSVVGTILGGVWANYSWGRFWGWDPKENGALMIVLWELAILHARMGGYIRDHGLCIMAILGGMVVAFSWWGVNLLGVGLHSYGFTTGVAAILKAFYGLELLIVLAAGAWWLGQNNAKEAKGGDLSEAELEAAGEIELATEPEAPDAEPNPGSPDASS